MNIGLQAAPRQEPHRGLETELQRTETAQIAGKSCSGEVRAAVPRGRPRGPGGAGRGGEPLGSRGGAWPWRLTRRRENSHNHLAKNGGQVTGIQYPGL